ncbi:MAG TPA: twin-arginine translocase TatA/TatE family subunit [Kiritimatiellia bacterium]|nr:twin-arginine translocase TatA/TatE family subunit [Kiritimatiellia bacterium]HRZ11989.1 twin-arginine translocase TatA/TatE family subunit [Kiritimatiellia bacterium]HSA17205.1 twin-arginine translocase TatA/TatE family subunit [Kiritimatiellia bacterium]
MTGFETTAFLAGNTGGGEILLVFVVALVLFGSKRLPGLARSLGRAIEEFRRAARDVSDEIQRASDEPPAPPPASDQSALPPLPPPTKDRDHEHAG